LLVNKKYCKTIWNGLEETDIAHGSTNSSPRCRD